MNLPLILALVPLSFSVFYYGTLFWWTLRARWDDHGRAARYALSQDIKLADDPTITVPGVSILLPAYNEGPVIAAAIRNAFGQDYPNTEIVVVDDGSTDGTLETLIDEFRLEPAELPPVGQLPGAPVLQAFHSRTLPIVVYVTENSGNKASTTNIAVNLARHPWVAIRDADELMEPDVLSRCMAEILHSNNNVVAVGATLLPSNHCETEHDQVVANHVAATPILGAQTIEYLNSYFVARPGMASQGVLSFVSGGFGLFNKDAILAVGGLTPGHMGEDMDLSLALHRYHLANELPYEITHVPEAIVWTEFPASRAQLRLQRRRWQWGLNESIRTHRPLLFAGGYGRFGRVGYGTLHVFEWWGHYVELLGWFVTALLLIGGWVEPLVLLTVFVATQGLTVAATAVAVLFTVQRTTVFRGARNLALLMLWTFFFAFGYRQLNVIWRTAAMTATNRNWGEMTRQGFNERQLELT